MVWLALAALSTAKRVQSPCQVSQDSIIGEGRLARVQNASSATDCCAACASNPQCQAFTFANARCELKDNANIQGPSPGSVSGVVTGHIPDNRRLYNITGAVEVATNENTIFLWREQLYLLENIPCYNPSHAGNWFPAFFNSSYARIRQLDTGTIIVNISSSIGYGFISAFPDYDTKKLWLFGSKCDRCQKSCSGCIQGCVPGRKVQSWWSTDVSLTDSSWQTAKAQGTSDTKNVQVARVSGPVPNPLLPSLRYVMIVEELAFFINDNADGDLTHGWVRLNSTIAPPALRGGPSIRYNPLDKKFYAITGGSKVFLTRTSDFMYWEQSPNQPFIQPSARDATISSLNGFPAVAESSGFLPMHDNYSRWDWNSNDADVCCMTPPGMKMPDGGHKAYVVWGAGTQGKPPAPPLTRANHCANIVGVANMSLQELLMRHFEPVAAGTPAAEVGDGGGD